MYAGTSFSSCCVSYAPFALGRGNGADGGEACRPFENSNNESAVTLALSRVCAAATPAACALQTPLREGAALESGASSDVTPSTSLRWLSVTKSYLDYSGPGLHSNSFLKYCVEVCIAGRDPYVTKRSHSDINDLLQKLASKGALSPGVVLPAVDRVEDVTESNCCSVTAMSASQLCGGFGGSAALASGSMGTRSKSLASTRSCAATDCAPAYGSSRSASGDSGALRGGRAASAGDRLLEECRSRVEAFLRSLFRADPELEGHPDVSDFFWEPVTPRGSLTPVLEAAQEEDDENEEHSAATSSSEESSLEGSEEAADCSAVVLCGSSCYDGAPCWQEAAVVAATA